jgi:hypothetical protein
LLVLWRSAGSAAMSNSPQRFILPAHAGNAALQQLGSDR